ncbi:MAG TPA: hypothetical protein VGL82_05010 [Bryobacteraceae bacterium]|jgi:hypothetical protein
MLRVSIFICLIAGLAVPLGAGVDRVLPSLLTVILDFKGPHSRTSLKEMERESGLIMHASGVKLDWRMLGDDPTASYSDLVVMTFRGTCEYEPAAPIYDELGPLASTRTTNGEVQPFGEVNCDRVVGSARTAMSGTDYSRADLLIGRAMGRVVAHELVHMLTRSGQHGTEGVYEPALSGKQLIAASLPLSALDIERLKQLGRRQQPVAIPTP